MFPCKLAFMVKGINVTIFLYKKLGLKGKMLVQKGGKGNTIHYK